MADLVQIPWQAGLWLTPSTMGYLQRASDRLGTQLLLTDSRSAWRSYASQKALYDAWRRDPKRNPVASNPDTGQRSHMRGAAFDLRRTDAAAQNACRAVGLIRDSDEAWHWNDPDWASMPIIPTNTSAAGGSGTLITEETVFATFIDITQPAKGYTLLGDAGTWLGITPGIHSILNAQGLIIQKPTKQLNTADHAALVKLFPPVNSGGDFDLSDEDVAEIVAALEAGSDDAVLAAISASNASVLAAIKAADDNDLAQWGLKRI
jgi:hypothetical protein